MNQLVDCWKVSGKATFLLAYSRQLENLRINDLRDKIWYSQLFELLNKSLKDKIGLEVIPYFDIENIRSDKHGNLMRLYTNWGFTHAQGLLEVKIRVTNDFVLLIQIQGGRYMHGIEWLQGGKDEIENWEKTRQVLSENSFLDFFDFEKGEGKFPDCCVPLLQAKRRLDKNRYNKYGKDFLYQCKNIKRDSLVDDIITAITEEVCIIYNKYTAK